MRLQLEDPNFAKNFGFYSKISRRCLVCESQKIVSNQFGILCECCGTLLRFE